MKDTKKKIEIIAKELTDSRIIPTDIYDICNRLDISVIRSDLKKQKAKGVFTKNGFVIKVSQSFGKNNPFNSFLIAHEIGHFILSEKLNILQESIKDYWKQECLCDYFSRLVLLPENRVKDIIVNCSSRPLDQYKLSLYLSNKFRINWKTCVHRISDYNHHSVFFELAIKSKSQDSYFIFELSTLPQNLLIKTKIKRQNKDRELIYNRLFEISNSQNHTFAIGTSFLKHPLFKRFPNWEEGLFVKNGNFSIRMIIKSKKILQNAQQIT